MDEQSREKYHWLFNQMTDCIRIMETIRDECVVMEAVPEYDPTAQPLGDKQPGPPRGLPSGDAGEEE